MTDRPVFTVTEKRKEAEREAGMRRSVYPRRVEQGKMTWPHPNRLIALMEAIADYAAIENGDRLL